MVRRVFSRCPSFDGRSAHTALARWMHFSFSPNIYEEFLCVARLLEFRWHSCYLFEIGISDVFIFAALRKEVQLVLYESVCAVRTQSELSGSPALLVSARLYTHTHTLSLCSENTVWALWLSSSACVGPSPHTHTHTHTLSVQWEHILSSLALQLCLCRSVSTHTHTHTHTLSLCSENTVWALWLSSSACVGPSPHTHTHTHTHSLCAVRTQSELSGSPALLVSARLHTHTHTHTTTLSSVQWEHSLSSLALQLCLCRPVSTHRLCSLRRYFVSSFLWP